MHKFGPAKEKVESWPFSSQRNLNILQNKLSAALSGLHLLVSSFY